MSSTSSPKGNECVVLETYCSTNCNNREEYDALHNRSVADPVGFWGEIATGLDWFEKPKKVVDVARVNFLGDKENVNSGNCDWFEGGKLNASVNCVDRWATLNPEKVAIIEEGDDLDRDSRLTYGQLKDAVSRFANVLKSHGVTKGTNVAICLPSIWQAPVAMLACARIGAVHTVVFAGFSAGSLSERMVSSKCEFLITCDIGKRGGKNIDLFSVVIEATKLVASPSLKVIVFRRAAALELRTDGLVGEVVDAAEEMEKASNECAAEALEHDHPMFILHTSGSTGAPKGMVHRLAGYLNYVAMTMKYSFDIVPEDVYCCVADVGWITGHSYVCYGPLLSGTTMILFESLPTYPDEYRFWNMIQKHSVTKFYTTPTATRMLSSLCKIEKIVDMPSLKLIGSVGEPLTEDAWKWLYTIIGKEKCPIVDTFWQTECGGHVICSLPGTRKFFPGSAGLPMLGVEAIILDFESGKEIIAPNQPGALCFQSRWPGLFKQPEGHSVEKWFGQYPGYYFTGDSGMYVEDKYIKICGRIDDAINVSGHLFSSREFEAALMESGLINDCAAVGIDHDVKGQAVCAFVVPGEQYQILINSNNDGNASNETVAQKKAELIAKLRGFVRKQIGPIAIIDHIFFIPELPKTRSGKIVRRLLRLAAAKNFSSLREADTSTLTDSKVVDQLIESVL